jgi:flagellar hook assembly protein FlgD
VEQNHPNPFNPRTTLAFSLPARAAVTVEILDPRGRRVALLQPGVLPAGRHELTWDGTDLRGSTVAGGIYLYRVRAGGEEITRKMVLLR